jgi:putative endonuclease
VNTSNDYYVYIVTNNTRSTLYIGVTSDLRIRVWQHRAGERRGSFAQRYHCAHLVYFEHYREVRDAIAREKQLKGWRRSKKKTLIATLNPRWEDLAADWFDSVEPTRLASTEDKVRGPSLRLRSGRASSG